jgi:hypothetical protein
MENCEELTEPCPIETFVAPSAALTSKVKISFVF